MLFRSFYDLNIAPVFSLLLKLGLISSIISYVEQQEFGLLKDKWILRRTKKLLIDQLPRKGTFYDNLQLYLKDTRRAS